SSSCFWIRSSRAAAYPRIGGKANRSSTPSSSRKITSVQNDTFCVIAKTLGVSPSAAAIRKRYMPSPRRLRPRQPPRPPPSCSSDQERDDQGEQRGTLDQCRQNDRRRLDVACDLRLTRHALRHRTADTADADRRADHRQTRAQRLAEVAPANRRSLARGIRHILQKCQHLSVSTRIRGCSVTSLHRSRAAAPSARTPATASRPRTTRGS